MSNKLNRQQMLLIIAAEECNELGQRISKALRFGVDEIQPGQDLNNMQRIMYEYTDLLCVMGMIADNGKEFPKNINVKSLEEKRTKVEKYLKFSQECGTLQSDEDEQVTNITNKF